MTTVNTTNTTTGSLEPQPETEKIREKSSTKIC